MLVDEITITLKGGHGGAGKVSFYPGFKSGPDGGNGGHGGNLYINVVSDLTILNRYSHLKEFVAPNGENGGSNQRSGKDGDDKEMYLPVGSYLEDLETGEVLELNEVGELVLIAEGGLGGRGNSEFKSARNTTPEYAQPGLDGEIKKFKIVLKLIADYGLIGLPNAGKSSLLNELTAANARVADYPFTTLEPNLGVLWGKIIADIPGLIEGASEGKGLGVKFLKHIEKVKLLLHCITADSEDYLANYQIIRNELGEFNQDLLKKEEIILITKSDLVEKKILEKKIKVFKKKKVLPVSIHDFDSLEMLKKALSLPVSY